MWVLKNPSHESNIELMKMKPGLKKDFMGTGIDSSYGVFTSRKLYNEASYVDVGPYFKYQDGFFGKIRDEAKAYFVAEEARMLEKAKKEYAAMKNGGGVTAAAH